MELPAEPASIGEARRFVAEVLDGEVEADQLDAALVIASELATNAVLHAGTGFELVLRVGEGGLRLEVHDGDPRLPHRKRYSATSGTGRGLILVESLATVAGAEQTEGGKVVWAVLGELPAEPPVVGGSDRSRHSAATPLHPVPDLVAPPYLPGELQVAAHDDDPDVRGRASLRAVRVPSPA